VAGAIDSCHNEPSSFSLGSVPPVSIILRSLLLLAAPLLAALLAGLLVSPTAAAVLLAATLVVFVSFHIGHLARLAHWSALPRQREVPDGLGTWRVPLERLARFMKQEARERTETAAELERVHAAVDLLPDGLVVLDRYNHVQWSNRAAQQLHGIFGTRRPIDHFVRQTEFLRYLEAEDFANPVVLTLPSAPTRLYELRVVPTSESYRLLVSRDVTDATRLEQMRRDFVANVSHEIRTPLTVIGGFVETLLEVDMPEAERRRCLELARRQAWTLQRLVDDLLTLATLESATQPAASERVDVDALLQSMAAEARALSNGQHDIAAETDEPGVGVLAAPNELESAVRNLLSNAVRYTPAGGRIRVEWRRRGDEGVLSVQDTGIGIATEHLPRLTERFYRVDRGRSRETGGTGLGLAIVKHVAQRHQATLDIRSRQGAGSTFSLRLPANRVIRSGTNGGPAAVGDSRPASSGA
jgi:two-component system, OmpR family, phosphate regulon sensor histidine kinase PhoR